MSIEDCKQRPFVLHHGRSREFLFLTMHAHERKSASAQAADIPQQLSEVREVPIGDIALASRFTQRQYTLSSWHGSFNGPSRTYKTSRTIWLTRQIGVANSGLHSLWSALG